MVFIFDRDIPSFRLEILFNRIGGDTITIQYKFSDLGCGSSVGYGGVHEPTVWGASLTCGNNVLIRISLLPD